MGSLTGTVHCPRVPCLMSGVHVCHLDSGHVFMEASTSTSAQTLDLINKTLSR